MEENNKIIAEFMGLEVLYRPNSNGFIEISDTELCDVDDLMYHTSWDWLMPVVYKILWLEDYEDESYDDIHNGLTNALLTQTYDAVVEFINQHNNNNERH